MKQFHVEMRVVSASVNQIPAVEFAYFDPSLKTYQLLHSAPIPLTVAALPKEKKSVAPAKEVDTTASHVDVAHKLAPIEIEGIKKLRVKDLSNMTFGTWKIFWILPLALIAWLLQLNYYKVLQQNRAKIKPKSARQLLEEALLAPRTSSEFYRTLSDALLLRLKEKELIPATVDTAYDLPEEGMAGKVREFLLNIEEKRFTGQEVSQSIQDEAKALFEAL